MTACGRCQEAGHQIMGQPTSHPDRGRLELCVQTLRELLDEARERILVLEARR